MAQSIHSYLSLYKNIQTIIRIRPDKNIIDILNKTDHLFPSEKMRLIPFLLLIILYIRRNQSFLMRLLINILITKSLI